MFNTMFLFAIGLLAAVVLAAWSNTCVVVTYEDFDEEEI